MGGGPQYASQEILRDRLLLSHRARPSAKVTLGAEGGGGGWGVPASPHLLLGLSTRSRCGAMLPGWTSTISPSVAAGPVWCGASSHKSTRARWSAMPTRISPGVIRVGRRASLSSFAGPDRRQSLVAVLDSKVVPYPGAVAAEPTRHLGGHHPGGGAAILRRLSALPASQWRQGVIDTPHRRHQRIRYLDDGAVPGYKGALRQRAVTGVEGSTDLVLVQQRAKESARALIVRYAGRNRVEEGVGMSVNFFHVDGGGVQCDSTSISTPP